jgi:hypothetical protein
LVEGVVTVIVVVVAVADGVMVEEEKVGGLLHDVNVSEEGGVVARTPLVVEVDSRKREETRQ